jgi:hypothetical protein
METIKSPTVLDLNFDSGMVIIETNGKCKINLYLFFIYI